MCSSDLEVALSATRVTPREESREPRAVYSGSLQGEERSDLRIFEGVGGGGIILARVVAAV